MPQRVSLRIVAAVSLVFTYLFFFEYLPPFHWVHIQYDLDGYHYPLADYAFQALTHGRFPEWDPAIYSGMSFAGNIQAALFYPPTWLMYATQIGNDHLSYDALEIFVIAHVWLAFVLCYAWLRRLQLTDLACALGAGIFAFSGYACLQLQHQGLIAGYAWFPLGLMGIDQAAETKNWRPSWKLVVASALCFLAGYPPLWFVFAVCMGAYALAKPAVVLKVAASLGMSLLVAMVQLLPVWYLTDLMVHENRYGPGFHDPKFYLSYLFPNFFNFGIHVPAFENPGMEYLYLGAPAILGIVWLVRTERPRRLFPLVGMLGIVLIFLVNPFHLVGSAVASSTLISGICRDWCFLAGPPLAIAGLAAYGLDDLLKRKIHAIAPWIYWPALVLLAGWSTYELSRWWRDHAFPSGWRSVSDPAITLVIVCFVLIVLIGRQGPSRTILAVALLMAVGIDYKAFGTSKRFNATPGAEPVFTSPSLPEMALDGYAQLHARRQYRILIDANLSPLKLRHVQLATPQGFDPFFTTRYRDLMQSVAHFRSNWEFDIEPDNVSALRLLGIRYVITSEAGPLHSRLRGNPDFRPVGSEAYYRIFEWLNAQPVYGWEVPGADRRVEVETWTPEDWAFKIASADGGRFTLAEQFLPGWEAKIDGNPVAIESWKGAFQAVTLSPGQHKVEFLYRAKGLRVGAWISVLSLIALGIALRLSLPKPVIGS